MNLCNKQMHFFWCIWKVAHWFWEVVDWEKWGGGRTIPKKASRNTTNRLHDIHHWWSRALTISISLAQWCPAKCGRQIFRKNAEPHPPDLVPTMLHRQNGILNWGYGDLAAPWSASLVQTETEMAYECLWWFENVWDMFCIYFEEHVLK